MRRATFLILSLTLAAFLLRVFRLDAQGLWYDEAFSVYLAHFALPEITARTAADIQPPLYYYLLHFWIAFAGDSEFALRFLSLVFGVLTIPLLYVTAHKLFDARAALLAALIATLSPLYLWYSQEARMYTLITFLLLLSSYAMLAATDLKSAANEQKTRFMGSSRRGWWVVFVLANIAAVYTHYFAFAVIAFQFLYVLVSSFRFQSFRLTDLNPETLKPETLKLSTVSLGAILLAFTPWLPNVLARFGQDVSYWRGALKLDEAIRHIFINFTMGESVLEAQAQWLAAGWLLVFLIGLIAWIKSTVNSQQSTDPITPLPHHPITYLALYLLVPLALLLLLFSRNPKFNPRYLMIASPPFFILLSAGLVSLSTLTRASRFTLHAPRFTLHPFGFAQGKVLRFAFSLFAFCFLFFASAFADYNAYTDPAFTKADFRKIARYIEANAAHDEAIVLTSGHLFPAFNYYYRGDLRQIRLPDDPTLNTEHIIGYDAAYPLNQTLAGARGAWVVLWQDEVVDPNGFLPMFLSSRGKEEKVDAAFYQVKLRHWRLTDDKPFASAPEPTIPRRANFKNQIELLGLTPTPMPADVGASFNLDWNALEDLADDYQVALRVRDAQGNLWGKLDRRPAGYNYPTTRWKKGEQLFGAYTVPLLSGTPAGEYFVEVTLYTAQNPSGLDVLAPNGAPLGKSVKLGPIAVLPATTPPTFASLNTLRENTISAPLGPFTLLGYQLGRDKASAGETIPLTLFWRVDSQLNRDYTFRVQFGDALSDTYYLPLTTYRANDIVRTQYQIAIPAAARDGSTTLRVVLSDGASVALAPFVIEKTDRVFVRPNVQIAQDANFGGVIALVGYDAPPTLKPNEALKLNLYWQARAKSDKPLTVFVHLLDKNGQVVAQKDAQPVGGARPTTTWIAGEYLADAFQLPLATLPAGEYRIEIGWYDASDPQFARLQVIDDNGAAVGDHVILKTTVTIRQ